MRDKSKIQTIVGSDWLKSQAAGALATADVDRAFLDVCGRWIFTDEATKDTGETRDLLVSVPTAEYNFFELKIVSDGSTTIAVYRDVSTTSDGTALSQTSNLNYAGTPRFHSSSMAFYHSPTVSSGTQTIWGHCNAGNPFVLEGVMRAGTKMRILLTSRADSNYVNTVLTWNEHGSVEYFVSSESSSSTASSVSSSSSSTASSTSTSQSSTSTSQSSTSQSSASSTSASSLSSTSLSSTSTSQSSTSTSQSSESSSSESSASESSVSSASGV